jgi:hypothetical protein
MAEEKLMTKCSFLSLSPQRHNQTENNPNAQNNTKFLQIILNKHVYILVCSAAAYWVGKNLTGLIHALQNVSQINK